MGNKLADILVLSVLISICCICSFAKDQTKTLLIFSADWCKYCQVAKHDINKDPELSETIKNYEVILIDYDKDKDIVEGHNIKSIPSFIIFEGGKEKSRLVGYKGPKHLNNFLK